MPDENRPSHMSDDELLTKASELLALAQESLNDSGENTTETAALVTAYCSFVLARNTTFWTDELHRQLELIVQK